MSLVEMIKLPFVNHNAPCLVCKKCSLFMVIQKGYSYSKHNVAPLYWSLPLSVLYQRLRQIMVSSNHSLISLIFSLVKEYLPIMNLEISNLHFEKKNVSM